MGMGRMVAYGRVSKCEYSTGSTLYMVMHDRSGTASGQGWHPRLRPGQQWLMVSLTEMGTCGKDKHLDKLKF